MLGQNFLKSQKHMKIFQLCMIIFVELLYLATLLFHPTLGKHIYDNSTLFILCVISWISLIMQMFFIVYDFYKLRTLALSSHILNKKAYLDNLTGSLNRNGLDSVFETFSTPESIAQVGCFMVTIHNLKAINEAAGYDAGDNLIKEFTQILEQACSTYGIMGRNSSNLFVVILNPGNETTQVSFINELQEKIQQYNLSHQAEPMEIKFTCLLNENEKASTLLELLRHTHSKLFEEK